MANTLLNATMITNQALMILVNQLVWAAHVNRQYDSQFGVDGAKIGSVTNIRKPPRYLGADGPGLVIEDTQDSTVPLALDQRKQVSSAIDTAAFRLQMVSFADQYLKPAMATLANKVDRQVALNYKKVANYAGAVGTMPATSDTYLNGGAIMDNEACPRDPTRSLVIGPLMEAKIVPALQGLFNPQVKISGQYTKGLMGLDTLGYDWYMGQNTATHTTGKMGTIGNLASAFTFTSMTAINDPNGVQIGSAVVLGGGDHSVTGCFKAGDVIEIANVNQINPQSHDSTTQLRHLVISQDADTDGSGNITVNVTPPIIAAGAFQTVDAAPVSGAAITVFGVATPYTTVSSKQTIQGMGFHRDAFTLAFADLPVPGGVDMAGRASDPQINLSVRFVRFYDGTLDRLVSRLDLLFGTQTLRQELAVRYPS